MGDSTQMDFGGLTLVAKAVQIGATGPATTGTDIATALTETGTLTATTIAATGNATVGGTLGVTGVSTLHGTTITSGGLTCTGDSTITGKLTTTKPSTCSTSTALAASGNAALDPTLGSVFTLTPTGSQNITASSAPIGAVVYIVVTTSGGSSFTQTFTTNFKTTATLATGTSSGKVFVLCFVGDGTNLNEVSRTAAM